MRFRVLFCTLLLLGACSNTTFGNSVADAVSDVMLATQNDADQTSNELTPDLLTIRPDTEITPDAPMTMPDVIDRAVDDVIMQIGDECCQRCRVGFSQDVRAIGSGSIVCKDYIGVLVNGDTAVYNRACDDYFVENASMTVDACKS